MSRLGSVVAATFSLLGLVGCAQGMDGTTSTPPGDVAANCPTRSPAADTTPGAAPTCNCPAAAVTGDTGDAGGTSPATAAVLQGDASPASADGGVDPVALLALLSGSPRSDPDPVVCPSNFSCQSFNGLPACMAQGALAPPSCQTNADCIAAGLTGVPCVTLSFDIAGAVSLPLPFCVKLCNSG